MRIKKHKEKSRLIVFQGEKILVFQKLKDKLEYGLIGGFLKGKESPEVALIRETLEETAVELAEEDLIYHCSVTIDLKDTKRVPKHYFICDDYYKPFALAEPHKFKNIKWVHWKEAAKFLGKSDKKVVKELFNPCKLNH
ncbi:NUDIX hydrolase [Aquimarina sp. MAR_2010_214]|uniref:NUDIX hydrolase n=1 Tax=Aquimarina TaxID=290174 RepID=UPI000C713053|nr:NUDIX hydrolase [Aquimarina sp. MAR_2010_214]PKV48081.1 NUDIX domain-containing protein [Aquimarina sp. MAR_2010_214]